MALASAQQLVHRRVPLRSEQATIFPIPAGNGFAARNNPQLSERLSCDFKRFDLVRRRDFNMTVGSV